MSVKNPAYKSLNSSSMIYIQPLKKVEIKSELASSIKITEEPKVVKVLPAKNPAYKNINSSSMIYVKSPEPSNDIPVKTSYTWSQTCTIY